MSFGSAPKPPAAQPITPVPQKDDPSAYDAQRTAAIKAKDRMGTSAHLLSEDPNSVSTDEQKRAATLG